LRDILNPLTDGIADQLRVELPSGVFANVRAEDVKMPARRRALISDKTWPDQELRVLRADVNKATGWRFRWEGGDISAKIADYEFSMQIEREAELGRVVMVNTIITATVRLQAYETAHGITQAYTVSSIRKA
jgi:hypothetical protein